jgi:N-acetylmuramoyl-L-alanine amidase
MNVAEIQRALLARGYDLGKSGADGDFGLKTRKAALDFLAKNPSYLAPGAKPGAWSDARLQVAAEQLIMCLGGVPAGTVDGLVGTQTKLARETWVRRSSAVPTPSKPVLRPCHTLVWHCTATPEGKEYTVKEIDAMHRARGFAQIGYHKIIHLDGTVSEGRPEHLAGAHVSGHNTGTLGYSYVGGVDAKGKAKDTRTPEQMQTMIRLTREAAAKYGLRAVVGHRDLSPDRDGDGTVEPHEWVKMCPCFNVIPEYGPLLKRAA